MRNKSFPRCGPWMAAMGLCASVACSPASLVDVQPPSGIVDPSVVTTPAGAIQLYNNGVNIFSQVLGGTYPQSSGYEVFLLLSGTFTDELMRPGTVNLVPAFGIDERTFTVPSTNTEVGQRMNRPRVQARQAREALLRYAPGTQALQGQLYALEAHSIIWLAELFCSGIPLTTVSLVGAATPTAGFSTQELLEHAVALFDSAITMAADSVRLVNFAKIGKGRALLDLGRFADAAAAVQGVPTDFVYNTEHGTVAGANKIGNAPRGVQVKDNEGGNGLVWSTDPRAAIMTAPALTGAMKIPAKYSRSSAGVLDPTQNIPDNPVRAADGLEARLIEAEADLATGGSAWLTILNTLRSTCVGAVLCAPVPNLTAAALPPLSDPGAAATRLDLLMQERAMWLYLTGHRQGDLRRLAHVYHRDPTTLWPTGTYTNPGFPPLVAAVPTDGTPYGDATVWRYNAGTTQDESYANPLYQGCLNSDP